MEKDLCGLPVFSCPGGKWEEKERGALSPSLITRFMLDETLLIFILFLSRESLGFLAFSFFLLSGYFFLEFLQETP